MKNLIIAITAYGMLLGAPAALADTASEIKAQIENANTSTRQSLKTAKGEISKEGSMEFWSSGGLLQHVSDDASQQDFKSFSLSPKHIEVITLVEDQAAVAMYYSEGAMQPDGMDAISHYLTRVTEVYVKEGGKWKVRASHYSPITGGQGTNQSSVQ